LRQSLTIIDVFVKNETQEPRDYERSPYRGGENQYLFQRKAERTDCQVRLEDPFNTRNQWRSNY
jgi:hypothetical protein